MLEAQLKIHGGAIVFKVTAENPKGLWDRLAQLQEIFDTDPACGICGGAIRFRVRETDKGDYYELTCRNTECNARLDFGQHKEAPTLFAKRKDKDGNWLRDNGWYVYRSGTAERDEPAQRSAAPQAQPPAQARRNDPPPPNDRW